MLLFIVPVLAWLYNQAANIASGVGDFLRSIPSLVAPKPAPLGSSYVPPFTGGQCAINYNVNFDRIRIAVGDSVENATYVLLGSIGGAYDDGVNIGILYNNGASKRIIAESGNGQRIRINSVVPVSGSDNCGNLSSPTPPPSINDDGLFKPTNPVIGDDNGTVNPAAIVLAPALPLVLVPLISSVIAAALSAARVAATALEAIQKVAEALEGLAELWKKLKEFLDEWEKNRPKNRDVVRQTYGRILGDGALDFFPESNQKFRAIQLDVVITNVPIGFGKFFGNLSPNRYRYKELGYIAFYSVNQGILEAHPIQFKRTSYQIPELAVGFIYHLGLDDQIKGYAFGTFSIEKT